MHARSGHKQKTSGRPAGTVRFLKLVEESGRPEPIDIWTAPEENPQFQSALQEHRVLSIQSPPTSKKKDFGIVGFLPGRYVSYLEFPKPLNVPDGAKVIGIRYDALKLPEPVGTPVRSIKPPPVRAGRSSRAAVQAESGRGSQGIAPGGNRQPQVQRSHRFRITLRFTATLQEMHELTAADRKAAIQAAEALPLPDFKRARIGRRVLRVTRL